MRICKKKNQYCSLFDVKVVEEEVVGSNPSALLYVCNVKNAFYNSNQISFVLKLIRAASSLMIIFIIDSSASCFLGLSINTYVYKTSENSDFGIPDTVLTSSNALFCPNNCGKPKS